MQNKGLFTYMEMDTGSDPNPEGFPSVRSIDTVVSQRNLHTADKQGQIPIPYSTIHKAASITVSGLRLVLFLWYRKMSISREWGTVSEEDSSHRRYASVGFVNRAVNGCSTHFRERVPSPHRDPSPSPGM